MYLFSTDRSSITFELEGIHPPSPDLPNQKIYHEGMRFTVRLSAFKAGATGQINRILKLIRSEWPEAHPSWPRSSAQPVPSPPLFTSPFARPSSPMMESLRSSWGYDCQTVNLLLLPPLVRYWITLPPYLLELASQVLTCGERFTGVTLLLHVITLLFNVDELLILLISLITTVEILLNCFEASMVKRGAGIVEREWSAQR